MNHYNLKIFIENTYNCKIYYMYLIQNNILFCISNYKNINFQKYNMDIQILSVYEYLCQKYILHKDILKQYKGIELYKIMEIQDKIFINRYKLLLQIINNNYNFDNQLIYTDFNNFNFEQNISYINYCLKLLFNNLKKIDKQFWKILDQIYFLINGKTNLFLLLGNFYLNKSNLQQFTEEIKKISDINEQLSFSYTALNLAIEIDKVIENKNYLNELIEIIDNHSQEKIYKFDI